MGIQAIGGTAAVDFTALAQSRATSASASTSQASQPATPKTGAAPPAGGSPPPPPPKPVEPSSTTTSSSSSTAQIFDKRDTNQDGTISDAEKYSYSLMQTTQETQIQSTVSTRQLQTGLSAYQQGQQTNGVSSSAKMFSI